MDGHRPDFVLADHRLMFVIWCEFEVSAADLKLQVTKLAWICQRFIGLDAGGNC